MGYLVEYIKQFAANKTQREAAKQLGITQPSLSRILAGKRRPRKTLEMLAKMLTKSGGSARGHGGPINKKRGKS